MAQAIALSAERRTAAGTTAARQLRARGRIPAVIYGHGRAPESLSIANAELERALAGHASGGTVFDLTIDGQTVQTLIREIQRHPYRPRIVHVDFLEIHAGEAITLSVPIRLVGTPDGVKNAGGVLDQVLRDVEIEVLPKDIPDHVDLDVSALKIGGSLHVSDLRIPEAEVLDDPDTTICTVVPPRLEAEPAAVEEVAEELAEPELIRKPKEEEEPEEDGEE